MNLIGRTLKVINWVLLGKGRTLIDVAERIAERAEIKVNKNSVTIKFKKEF